MSAIRFLLAQSILCTFARAACPAYDTIRSPMMDADKFNAKEVEGIWYLVATTEPTTAFCMCNVMNYSIYDKAYTYTDTCFQDIPHTTPTNITLSIGGDLSYDPASPGIFHEGFKLFNHTVTAKNPNMLFDIKRNAKGDVVMMHFYACLGKLVPIFGPDVYSYLLYSRDPTISEAYIKSYVNKDNNTHPGAFELDGYVVTGPANWTRCGVIPGNQETISV